MVLFSPVLVNQFIELIGVRNQKDMEIFLGDFFVVGLD